MLQIVFIAFAVMLFPILAAILILRSRRIKTSTDSLGAFILFASLPLAYLSYKPSKELFEVLAATWPRQVAAIGGMVLVVIIMAAGALGLAALWASNFMSLGRIDDQYIERKVARSASWLVISTVYLLAISVILPALGFILASYIPDVDHALLNPTISEHMPASSSIFLYEAMSPTSLSERPTYEDNDVVPVPVGTWAMRAFSINIATEERIALRLLPLNGHHVAHPLSATASEWIEVTSLRPEDFLRFGHFLKSQTFVQGSTIGTGLGLLLCLPLFWRSSWARKYKVSVTYCASGAALLVLWIARNGGVLYHIPIHMLVFGPLAMIEVVIRTVGHCRGSAH